MKKILLVIFVLCAALSLFFFWRLSRPGVSAFPYRVFGIPRTSGPEYHPAEGAPNVYVAVYGTSLLHMIQPLGSADEAKSRLQEMRANILKDQQNQAQRGGQPAISLGKDDQPQKDLLIYRSNERWHAVWVNGNWLCAADQTVGSPPGDESDRDAKELVAFAASVPYAPSGATPPADLYGARSFTLYDFFMRDLPVLIGYWFPVLIPGLLALIILPIMLLTGRKKAIVAGNEVGTISR
jgi:hypothetical protein